MDSNLSLDYLVIRSTLSFWSRFHQHFTSAFFCTKFWHQKLQSCVLGLKFFGAKIWAKKRTQNVDKIDYCLGIFGPWMHPMQFLSVSYFFLSFFNTICVFLLNCLRNSSDYAHNNVKSANEYNMGINQLTMPSDKLQRFYVFQLCISIQNL